MPNFDGGTYFFTALIPIDNRELAERDGVVSSPAHFLRQTLETLPTAMQSPATIEANTRLGVLSPFASNGRTHFARLFLIDDTFFNGRSQKDALLEILPKNNPMKPKPVDQLTCPYLAFVADFDAASGDVSEVQRWLMELWTDMGDKAREIFRYGWDFGTVNDAASFAGWMLRCQVETTMPFHDYWPGRPPLADMDWRPLLIAPALAVVLAAAAGIARGHLRPGLLVFFGLLIVLGAIALLVDRWLINRAAAKPLPPAPGSSLPGVLKALYLQQKFTGLVIAQQGADPQALHQAFGAFLAQAKPDDMNGPTQQRGTIQA